MTVLKRLPLLTDSASDRRFVSKRPVSSDRRLPCAAYRPILGRCQQRPIETVQQLHIHTGDGQYLRALSVRRTRLMKNFQQFSLESYIPMPFTSGRMALMMFSISSSGKRSGISPDANRSLMSTRKRSSAI